MSYFLIFQNIELGLVYPCVSAIDEKEAEGTMDFPAVTICNVNAIRISKLTKDDVYHVGQFFGLIQSDGVSEKVRVHLID